MPSTTEATDTGIAVVVTRAAGRDEHYTVTAWEPFANHASVRFSDDGMLGQITSRPLPASIEAMAPGSPERIAACVDFAAANVHAAYDAISEVFPELLERDDVEIDRGAVTCRRAPGLVPCDGRCGELVERNSLGIAWCGTPGR